MRRRAAPPCTWTEGEVERAHGRRGWWTLASTYVGKAFSPPLLRLPVSGVSMRTAMPCLACAACVVESVLGRRNY